MAKTAYYKWREKYGVSRTPQKPTNNNDEGKQSNSAPSTRTTPTGNTNSKSAYDKWREKYGVSGAATTNPATTKQPTKKHTDFNTETKQAYTSAKSKANSKTTITSAMSEEDRKKRIKDIDAEIRNLNYKIQGLSRGASYVKNDGRGYLTNQTEEAKKKIEELSAKRKSLERVGTFTASEIKQFEIEDAKAEKAKLPNYNPTSRVSPSGVDAFAENAKAHTEADKRIDTLEREKALYDDVTKFGDVVNEDGFGGQWRSNYRFTELNEDASKASSAYMDNPTPENREIALAYKAFVEAYAKNNENALDDEGQVLPLLSDNFASHLAQQKGSAGKAIPLALAGAGIGLLGGLNGAKAGWTAGYSIGAGLNTYDVVRGSLFTELLSYGLDEETAMKYAEDDAVVEALIESGETAKDWLFMLYGGIKGKAGGAASKVASKATGKAAKLASKYAAHPLVNLGLDITKGTVLNAGTEYLEEGLQGAVSRGTRERAWATLDDETGQYGMGNIDLHNRPVYKNADGTISTVDSVTFEVDGKFVLLPTIVRDENGNAKRLTTNDEIIAHYVKTGEHLGMFDTVEEANGYATRLHYAQAYRYSDYTSTDADDNAVESGVKVLADAIFGGNIEAREELHEQGKEGFKTGLVSGGVQGTAKFAIRAFANAKTIKEQNEVADFIRNDKKTLTALIKEGKASGEGTVSAKLATEIEQARKSGNVTREQIKKLIASNEIYKDAKEQASRNNVSEKTAEEIADAEWIEQNENAAQLVVNDIRSGMSKDDLRGKSNEALIEREKVLLGANGRQLTSAEKKDAERLMKQYFLYKMASENPLQFMSQYGNKKQAGVTVADAQNATKFGDAGSVLVADFANKNNVSIEQAEGVIGTAYRAGLTGLDSNLVKFHNSLQRLAFQAGRNDRQAQDRIKQAIAKKASVYETGFTENEYSAKLTDDEREFFTVISKDLKMDTRFTDKIIADLVTGREANASHEDGKVRISNTSALAMLPVGIHEAFHRIRQLDPEASDAIMNFLYESSDQNARRMELGDKGVSVYELIRKDYGGNYDTIDYIEEIAAKRLQTLFKNPQEFLEWRAKLETNPQAKNGLQKLIEAIKEILEDMWAAITRSKMSLEAKRKAQAEIEQAKRLLAEAYIGAMNAAETRASKTNSAKNLEIKTNVEYNGNIQYSLQWHTDLNYRQLQEVEKWLRRTGNPESTKITDTANWYEGRINGQDLFVIYSTEVNGDPTILYETTGREAKIEKEILLELLEEIENGESVDGKSTYVSWVSGGGWVQKTNNIQNNLGNSGSGQNNQNAGVLQSQSRSYGSPAFWNVLKNISGIQAEINSEQAKKKSHSLKDSEGNTLTEAQAEFFKDSKVRDKDGNLLVVYHGTKTGGFTVFDRTDDIGYFFTDSENNAGSYSGTYKQFTPKKYENWADLIKDSEDNGISITYDEEANTYFVTDGWYASTFAENELEDACAEVMYLLYGSEGDFNEKMNYAGYLNITNPLIINGNGSNWNAVIDYYEGGEFVTYGELTEEQIQGFMDNGREEWELHDIVNEGGYSLPVYDVKNFEISYPMSTREWVQEATYGDYDGVIFKDILDSGSEFGSRSYESNVYVALKSNQFKSVENKKPTSHPDIRYSLKEEDINKLSTDEQNAVKVLGKGAEAIINKDGEMLVATGKNKSTVVYSLKTYENGGKEALEKALRENGHTEAEIKLTLSYVDDAADYLKILAAGYAKSHNYTALSDHLIADVITNVKTGKQVISSIVNNGEYPVNIDLALICKKRVAYMNLMNRLIDDGIFDKVNYGGEAIAKVNDLLRSDGFETACLGCFVESRRLQFQTWAETIVQEWNAEVDKRKSNAGSFNFAEGKAILTDAEMDALAEELKNAGKKNAQGNLNLGKGSVQTKMGRLLDKVPSLQKHLTGADLLKPEGLTALRAYDSNLFSIVKSRYGAASPKIVQDYNPYASEIAMMTFSSVKSITSNAVKGADAYRRKVISEMGGRPVKQKGETEKAFKERKAEFNTKVEDEAIRRYLYDIGGARIQSFSDFMIENVFDYIQIFADLSAKRLPLHGYTKEIIALRLFGMTGAKWNGSWIAHVDRAMGKEYAGLLPASEARDGNAILVHTDDGDYAIGFDDYARHKATNKKSFVQSIGMKDMLALQLDPRYSPYVGSITIGVSDKQILAMLDSPFFRFVIPYHSSGMLPQFAKLVGVDLYNDYTDYQNTTVNKWYDVYGNPCEPIRNKDNEIIKVDTSYNFNAEVQKTGDARKAADNYLKWCGQKHPVYDGKNRVGYVTFNPKFSNSPYGTDFTKHENYYKMLEDFNVYDSITEESAVQGAVTMNFPSEQNRLSAAEMEAYKARLRETGIFSEKEIEKYAAIADKTFKELIADEVKGRAEYQQAQSPKWENTVKNVEQMLLADHQRHSLKGGVDVSPQRTSEYLDAVEAVQKGKKGAAERLAKYVDEGMIRTEAYDKLVEKYGAIPKGEKPSREVQVPQKTSENKKVSQTVRTILEAKVTPDSAVPTIEKMVEDGVFSYDVYTDKQAIKDADSYIKEYGWDESLDDWFDAVEKGEVSKQITAMGWALYNNAANTASTTTSETERTSAVKTSLKILDAMIRHQRSAAQALQATRILKKLSPETQLYAVQKSVQSLQNELADKYGDKAPNLKVNEELAEQFINAKTPEERAKIEEEIYKDIGRQMPSRFIDKWNAWRYLAMLGNLRTHGRNIIGNAFFAPVVVAKDMTATAIESAVHRISGKKTVRGKSIIVGNKVDRMLLKAAWADYSNVADMVTNGGKYNDSALKNKHIEEGRQIFKFKPLEWARKKNSELLEVEDMWFAQPHYAFALAQYCKANNITAEQISKGRAIAPAREYAIKEAQKATYRDTNAFSQLMSEIGRRENRKNGLTKTVSAMIEGILPFRKTPANILVRGIEYSPIGLLKGLSYDLVQASKGKMSSSEVIDNISAGLTGTGLLALGVLLAAQGLVRGHGEDEDEKGFKELMGHQAYALELPNGQSMTLDWLAPEALPFFVGVNIWETTSGTDEELNLSSILQAISRITEPMLEMSCLQGVNDLLESIGYASSNDTSGLVSVLSSAATSYLSQIFPTLSGQAERTGEEYRMTTYTEKNSFLTGDMQYTLGKFSTKIPFWDYNQIPYIDAWGRKEASGAALKRGLNNFLNPAYTSTIETSKMEEELLRLFEQTGEGGVFPSRADKYFTVDGVRKDLTADEYVRYATLKGEKSYKLVSDLVKSSAYKKLSDEEKAKTVKEAYDYANQKAKQAISNYKPDTWVKKADEFGSNVGNYIAFKTEISGTKEENGGKISKEEVVDIIQDMAQNGSETWKMYLSMYDTEKDMYAYNKGIQGEDYMDFLVSLDKYDKPTKSGKYGSYTQEEAYRAINSLKGLSRQEKATLWQSVNSSWKAKNNPFR